MPKYSRDHATTEFVLVHSKKELDEIFTQPQHRSSLDGILATIISRSRQYRISYACEPDEILAEAYIRAKNRLEAQGEISNIFGWLHLTSHNIIREVRRKEAGEKERSQLSQADSTTSECNVLYESSVTANVLSASQAFQKLSKLEQRIFHYRKIVGLSWREVCLALAEEELLDKNICTDNKAIDRIRKRGNRILPKLRAGYD